ncbi:hypothetical protein CHUAL_013742 [Chamberlinius hualienensis]
MKRCARGKLVQDIKKDLEAPNSKQIYANFDHGHGRRAPLPALNSNMASYIVCLTAGGGVPLFISKYLQSKTLPFPVVGSLNGVHMFTKSHKVAMLSCTTNSYRIVWREYESVTLIGIASKSMSSDLHLYQLLDTIYRAMILFVGLQDIVRMKNVEKLKRDLRCCSGVIDRLRVNHFETNIDVPLIGDLVRAPDCVLCNEAAYLNTVLDVFAQSADTTYGCLFANGKIVAATRDWWSLDSTSITLIAVYLQTSSKVSCRDLPLFLSHSEAPYRLLVFKLISNTHVCLLCGPTPTLTQLIKDVHRYWKDSFEALKCVAENERRSFPSTIQVDRNILGLILVNHTERKCLCSIYPHGDETDDKVLNPNQRLNLLRKFYSKTVTNLFGSKSADEFDSMSGSWLKTVFTHQCLETYSNALEYKLYAIQNAAHQIFILFNSKIPTYCTR